MVNIPIQKTDSVSIEAYYRILASANQKNRPQRQGKSHIQRAPLLYWRPTTQKYKHPMRFFYTIPPAHWLKVAFFSLVLGSGSAWYLVSYRSKGNDIAKSSATSIATSSAPSRPTNALFEKQLPPLPAPPETTQTHSVAPAGILDQFSQFTEISDFDDTPIKPTYSLPAAVAPSGLLDPLWTGAAP